MLLQCVHFGELLKRLLEFSLLHYLGVTDNALIKIYQRNWKIHRIRADIDGMLMKNKS